MVFILIKHPRAIEVNGQEKIINKPGRWLIKDNNKDFHLNDCIVPKEKLQKEGFFKVGKNEFSLIKPNFNELLNNIRRDVQIITNKDLGFILSFTGFNKGIYLEAGTGSGASALFFSFYGKETYTIDVREEAGKKIKEEAEFFDKALNTNLREKITFYKGSFYDKFILPNNKKADLTLLDLPEPWRAWNNVLLNTKLGSWVIGYTPNANQLSQFVNEKPEEFILEKSCEIIERIWKVKELILRPETKDFSHTAFLSFFRRIK